MTVFDIKAFVAECQAAVSESQPTLAVREVLDRAALADRDAIGEALRPERGGIELLLSSATLTVLHVVWAPGMAIPPHEHRMWAAIGVYTGQEDNSFYRRVPGGLEASGGRDLRAGDALLMGDDAVHAVANPLGSYTGGIHVYGGDFVNKPRSQWDPDTFAEEPYDYAELQRRFEAAEQARSLSD